MEKISDAIAGNVRQIRDQRKLSLDNLSALTGVSKSMLAQIERGNANPTVSTIRKIADGLKIPFTQLVSRQEQDIEIVEIDNISPLPEDDGHYRNYPIFPFEDSRPFEIYRIELDPDAFLQASAHPQGTQEYIVVSQGRVQIVVNGQTLVADPSHAVRFKADLPHSYHNNGPDACKLCMVISYA